VVVYARSRPGYLPSLVNALAEEPSVVRADCIADIGARTGIFSELRAKRGRQVTALEPDDEMLSRAVKLPGIRWVQRALDPTTLADSGRRWIVASQLSHLAGLEAALPEMEACSSPVLRLHDSLE
jgi:hypothetical protein